MMGSSKGNWGRYSLQAFGISVLGSLFLDVSSFLATLLLTEWKRPQARSTPQLELSPILRQVLKIVLLKVVS